MDLESLAVTVQLLPCQGLCLVWVLRQSMTTCRLLPYSVQEWNSWLYQCSFAILGLFIKAMGWAGLLTWYSSLDITVALSCTHLELWTAVRTRYEPVCTALYYAIVLFHLVLLCICTHWYKPFTLSTYSLRTSQYSTYLVCTKYRIHDKSTFLRLKVQTFQEAYQ